MDNVQRLRPSQSVLLFKDEKGKWERSKVNSNINYD